ncbi:TlyA family RNA methyltransferase [Desulfuribacillus alkaliarsenatis]|uniref:TlyA family rRNA (Cytidine-2'-O)-methyltransferase n=1 Tax=Desulfuribacillus alkaliarsenatis TaxID=766136 RepID=A0A1E5G7R2_9FIRM|nr:TlyA family rRNA (cytidine-2'-O)-methyltransferase [Desulfuribacillus alkaliarsenatis]
MKKERVDVLLVEQGLLPTREKAKSAVMAGLVYTGSERIDKPGMKIEIDKQLTVKGNIHPYVGRGGLKLEQAIKEFSIKLNDKVMIDIGASTGGFTDCALQNGVGKVYAVDVGYGQLDWKLRNDPRVIVLERTNFRHLEADKLKSGVPNVASIDVSFISLKLIFPKLMEILADGGEVIALIKPQFEAGKDLVGKKGIVRDPHVHKQVLVDVISRAKALGFILKQLTFSPITGGDGNIEFLALFQLQLNTEPEEDQNISNITDQELELFEKVIENAHSCLS